MIARMYLSAILSVVLATVAGAAERKSQPATSGKHLLQYKFQMGEVLRYEVKHATNVRTTIDTTTQQAESQSESVKAWKVTDVLPSGEMEFIHLVERARMSNQTPGHPANVYDSTVDNDPPRGFEQAARSIGMPLTLCRIAADGEVTFREEKQPVPDTTPDMPITLRLPKKPIAVGEKWDHPYEVMVDRKSGTKQQIRTRRLCKLEKVTNGIAVIDVEYQILTPCDAYARSQLVERLTEGTVRFDVERGRIVEQEHNVDKRVLGFAGKASSMHFVSRLREELLKPKEDLGKVQPASATAAK